MNLSGLKSRFKGIYTFERLRHQTKKYIKEEEYLIDKDTVFLVFVPATDYYYLPYFQLYQFKNVFVHFSYINSNELILKTLRKISSNLIYGQYTKKKYDPTKKYIAFFDGQYSLCSQGFKQYLLSKYPGCKIVFHLGDLLSTHKNIHIDEIKEFSDMIVTYDHNDADNNGLTYHSDPYSQLPAPMLQSNTPKSNIVFFGLAKNRAKEILKVYDVLKEHSVSCMFNVPDLSDSDCETRPELAGGQFKPYLDYLKVVQSSDCILEIIQGGSRGGTFRTWEAVVYNKKLITNNQSIKDEPYYNPDYIQVIDSLDSIDIDWLMRDIVVDFGFAEKMSPRACFEFYLEVLKNKEE